jgi:hypothetical protein
MNTIIASFKRSSDAVVAVKALRRAGFVMGAEMPLVADPEFEVSAQAAVSPGAEESGATATKGAAIGGLVGVIVGLTLTPFVGPAGAIAGAGVGAYTGSLVGALAGLSETTGSPEEESGASLKVVVTDPAGRARVVEILHQQGAAQVNEE